MVVKLTFSNNGAKRIQKLKKERVMGFIFSFFLSLWGGYKVGKLIKIRVGGRDSQILSNDEMSNIDL